MSTVPPNPDPVPQTSTAPAGASQPTVAEPGPAEAGPAEAGASIPAASEAVHEPGTPAHQLVVPRTRTSSTWTGIGIGLFVLLLVIIFISQNTASTRLTFLWLHGSAPVGLAVLLAFVLGGTVVLLLGAARLAQLRLMARRHRRDPRA